VVTFDEDDFTASNQIPTLFAGPMVRPGAYPEAVNHYLLLRTLEAMYALPALGKAANNTPPSATPGADRAGPAAGQQWRT